MNSGNWSPRGLLCTLLSLKKDMWGSNTHQKQGRRKSSAEQHPGVEMLSSKKTGSTSGERAWGFELRSSRTLTHLIAQDAPIAQGLCLQDLGLPGTSKYGGNAE